MFGGPSKDETSTLQEQKGLSAALSSRFNEQYANQQDALKRLNSQIFRIQTGQTGPGFSGAEYAARQALIQNTSAAASRNAIQAVRERGAGSQNTSGMARQSGINAQVAGGIEALAGTNAANKQLELTAENYAQGRANAASAASGLQALQGDYNPTAYSGELGQSLNSQFKMADTINQQNIARSQAIMGFGTKLALGAATFGIGAAGALGAGESLGEGVSDAFSGGMNALTGSNFGINN